MLNNNEIQKDVSVFKSKYEYNKSNENKHVVKCMKNSNTKQLKIIHINDHNLTHYYYERSFQKLCNAESRCLHAI